MADDDDDKLYAYNLSSGMRDTTKEFDLHSNNGNARGIWSDGATMWVADRTDDKLYAYSFSGVRKSDKDFNTLAAGNILPTGIWSDGQTMWVADRNRNNNKVYSYNAPPKSTDATLGAITVDGTAIPFFDADRTSYEYGVASAVAQVTIAATTTDSNANWSVTSPADADTADGHQVNLSAGKNTVTIRVTAEDTAITEDYTLSVNSGVDTDYGWKAVDDLDGLIAAGHANPIGLWSNGATFWVVNDSSNDKIFAYNADGTHDSSNDFNTLDAANTNPRGIWSDGTTMWVAENNNTQDKLFAYRLSNKQRDATKDFDTLHAAGNNDPFGLWSDGTTMWVVDFDKTIYAYRMSDKQRDSSKDFTTLDAAENDNPFGIWSDGATMWVTDDTDDKIYAYRMSDKERDSSKDFNTLDPASNDRPHGLWSDGQTMWVVDNDHDKVFSYNKPASDVATLKSITVSPGDILRFDPDRKNYNVGVASDVTEATITVETNQAFATFVSNPADPDTSTPAIEVRNLSVGANTVAITVTAEDAATVETYTVSINRSTDATFGWNAVQDLDNFAPDATSIGDVVLAPKDLTRNDGTFLVLFQDQNYLRAYDADGTRDTTLDVALDNNNDQAEYIHTDGQNFWISDQTDDKIYVYDTSGNRQETMEFDLDPDNSVPNGIWSDGTTMWVTDATDDKVYAYSLSGTRQMAKEFDLHSSNGSPRGIWSDGVTIWVADEFGDRIFAYSLDDHSQDTSKEFRTLAAAGNGVVLGIWSDGTTMWVMDQDDVKAYAYNMPVSDNTELRTITVDGEEIPNSDPATRTYTVEVEQETTQVTIAAQVRQIKAEITGIGPADADSADGHQVELTRKTTYVRIEVRAQNGSTHAYRVAITNRALSVPPRLTLRTQDPRWDENRPRPTDPSASNRIAFISTSDPDGNDRQMTFSLDTTSQEFFTIFAGNNNAAALLHNRVPLDHEAMPVHNVVFTATDEDGKVATIDIAITVNDLDEPGVVQLVPVAITGIPVTAVVDDPDQPVSSETWQWYRGDTQNGPWTVINGQTSDSYTPPDADKGKFYRVTATYSDTLGSGRSAEGVTDGPTVSTVCTDLTESCSQDDPASLAIGAPARARIDGIADTDWFRFTTQADKIYRIDMMGADTGHGNLPDPYLLGFYAAFNADNEYQADGLVDDPGDRLRYVWRDWFTGQQHLNGNYYNDDGGDGRNARLFIRTGAITGLIDTPGYPAGVYYVAAKPLAENQNELGNDATYQIVINEVEDQPASPADIDPFRGIATITGSIDYPGDQDQSTIDLNADERLLIATTGAAAPPTFSPGGNLADNHISFGLYHFTPDTAGDHSITIPAPVTTTRQEHGTGAYTVSIFSDPDGSELTVGTPFYSQISVIGDNDVFIANLDTGTETFKKYRIDVMGLDSGQGTLADPRLTVRSGQTAVHSDDGGQGRNARAYIKVGDGGFNPGDIRIEIEADTTGSYVVTVREASSNHIWHAHMRPAHDENNRSNGYCRAARTAMVTEEGETEPKEVDISSSGCAILTSIDPYGIISSKDFSFSGTDYKVRVLVYDPTFRTMILTLNRTIPDADLNKLNLTIQGEDYPLDSASLIPNTPNDLKSYSWNLTNPPWTVGYRLHDWVLVELSTKP